MTPVWVVIALVVGVALGVGLAHWLAHPAPRTQIPSDSGSPETVGQFRVTREYDGKVEVLHQGGGAKAAQLYQYHNPTQPGEVIAFYRGADRCSAKGQ